MRRFLTVPTAILTVVLLIAGCTEQRRHGRRTHHRNTSRHGGCTGNRHHCAYGHRF